MNLNLGHQCYYVRGTALLFLEVILLLFFIGYYLLLLFIFYYCYYLLKVLHSSIIAKNYHDSKNQFNLESTIQHVKDAKDMICQNCIEQCK